MIYSLMKTCNNFFTITNENKSCVFDSVNKTITFAYSERYLVGQIIVVAGSVLNDGAYTITEVAEGELTVSEELRNENSTVVIKGTNTPKDFVDLASSIATFESSNIGKKGLSGFTQGDRSESYKDDGGTWQNVYRSDIAKYKQVRW